MVSSYHHQQSEPFIIITTSLLACRTHQARYSPCFRQLILHTPLSCKIHPGLGTICTIIIISFTHRLYLHAHHDLWFDTIFLIGWSCLISCCYQKFFIVRYVTGGTQVEVEVKKCNLVSNWHCMKIIGRFLNLKWLEEKFGLLDWLKT
jgi:hypothetical protein